jgi:hypothetical protein
LRGSDGKEVTLSRWRGKPIILFYEDRHSTTLDSAFQEALFERGRALGAPAEEDDEGYARHPHSRYGRCAFG